MFFSMNLECTYTLNGQNDTSGAGQHLPLDSSDSADEEDAEIDELDAKMDRLSSSDDENPPVQHGALANDGLPAAGELKADHLSHIDSLRFTQQLIQEISSATLENDKLDPDMFERLQNPINKAIDISDSDTCLSLDIFMACNHTSEATYKAVRDSILHRSPNLNILSYYSVKKLVLEITGVGSILDDMCINSCIAFVGPLADLKQCPECLELRYDPKKKAITGKEVPRLQACTIPLSPQLQALQRPPQGAATLSYFDEKTIKVSEDCRAGTPLADRIYDDVFSSNDIQKLVEDLGLTADDFLVSFSLDGAQLYQNKKSDTWIGIWTIYNYNPATQYTNKHVTPSNVVPSPNKPKTLDSFLYCTFYHLSALQRENNGNGMAVWDALQEKKIYSRVVFLFGTADAVGLTELDGGVGHHGAQGC